MPRKFKAYIAIIIILGTAFFLYTLGSVKQTDYLGLVLFMVLSIIAESLLIVTPGERGLSVGFAIGLAAILVFGLPETAWIASIGTMLRVIKKDGKRYHIFNTPFYKTLFNGANTILSAGIGSFCYEALGGVPGYINIETIVIPIIASILSCILVNATIISILMHFITGETFFSIWYNNIIWVIKDYFAVAPLAVIMAIAYVNYGVLGVLLFFGPLLYARYAFKLYLDMRKIYIDTVKSLSQAIEAKDPYTMGHSMRVGEYACALARKLGLSGRKVENIKIAAILHDIGKIGVEENILNKPGRLTEEEFDKIKNHPEIGIRIIKGIDALETVSKIILHHHERYDGTGYPEGLKSDDIVLEAQILSLADVFDALTSERPYRRAMTLEEALKILDEGKGSQFEPKLADTFIKLIKENKELRELAG